MKKYFTFILLITLVSCKKESLTTKQVFVEQGAQAVVNPAPSWMGTGNIALTLLPDHKVEFQPGGDIVYSGTYVVGFKVIMVIVEGKTYEFEVISNTELRYEKTRVLLLQP